MKALVVGASGFLGGAIARQLLEKQAEVWGSYHANPCNMPDGCKSVSPEDLQSLDDTFDNVFVVSGNYSLEPSALIKTNVNLTQQITERFVSAKIIYISSVAVYGTHDEAMTEDSSYNNPSFYGLAKLGGELITQTHDRYAIVRLTYLYGPEMPTNSFIPRIIEVAKANKHITLYGNGKRLQDYLHVQDAARLCYAASLQATNDIYLGATGTSLSNADIAQKIQNTIPNCVTTFENEDRSPWFKFDNTRTMQKLNWKPIESIDTFIETSAR